jgi:pilus assembly protein CpaC
MNAIARAMGVALFAISLTGIALAADTPKFLLPIEKVGDILGPVPGVTFVKAGNSIVFQGMTQDPQFKVKIWRLKQSFSNIVDMTGVTAEGMEQFKHVKSEWRAAIVDALNTGFDPGKSLALAQDIDVRLEGGRLVVSGEVNNPEDLATIERLAKMYDDNPVINATARNQMIELNVIFLGIRGEAGMSIGSRGLQNFKINVPNYNAAWNPAGPAGSMGGAYNGGNYTAAPWNLGIGAIGGGLGPNTLAMSLGVDESDITTLVRPHLSTMNGQPAVFHSGGQIAFEVSNQNMADVIYKDYGTKLTARPVLTSDGQIDVAVELEFLIPQGSRTNTLDNLDFIKYSHSGRAVLGRGQAMVLSGMMSQMRQYDVTRTPGISRIPIINFFFGQKNRKADNEEMVVIIMPHLPSVLENHEIPPFRDGLDANQRSAAVIGEMVYEERPPKSASESIHEPQARPARKPFWRR